MYFTYYITLCSFFVPSSFCKMISKKLTVIWYLIWVALENIKIDQSNPPKWTQLFLKKLTIARLSFVLLYNMLEFGKVCFFSRGLERQKLPSWILTPKSISRGTRWGLLWNFICTCQWQFLPIFMFWYQFEQRQGVSLPLMAVISFKAMGRLGVKNDKKKCKYPYSFKCESL